MARIEEKSLKDNKLVNKILLWAAVGFLAAVLVASIVILVLWLVGKNDDEDEFVEKFETAQVITFEQLELMLDDSLHSTLLANKEAVYVYVYNPDYEAYPTADFVHDKVLETVEAYNAVKANESNSYAFYIVNVTDERNVEYLSENPSSYVSGLGTSYPYLVRFEEEQSTLTDKNAINAELKDIINLFATVE